MACRQLAGIQDEPLGRGAVDASANADVETVGAACGMSFMTPACQACADPSCCAQITACSLNPKCTALETCLDACAGDAPCRTRCASAHPITTIAAVPPIDQCLAAHCERECRLPCGGLLFPFDPDARECGACLSNDKGACASEEACAKSESCQTLLRCQSGCRTQDCFVACGTANPNAAVLLDAFRSNVENCRDACQIGNYWSCVGSVRWPFAKPLIAFTVSVQDHTRHTPVSDLVVKMCRAGDPACATYLDRAVTTNGTVTLLAHNPAGAAPQLNGYLEISSPSMAIVPTLYFWSAPLSEADARLLKPIPTFSPADFETLTKGRADPTRGHVFASAYDCSFRSAPGVGFTSTGIDLRTTSFYLFGGVPVPAATATDNDGMGGFVNVPTVDGGTTAVTVTSTPSALGRPSSEVTVFVRAGTITVVDLVPTP